MSVAEVEAMLALEAPDAGGGQDPGAAKLLDANAVIRRTAMLRSSTCPACDCQSRAGSRS
jgi:hypothetical protein